MYFITIYEVYGFRKDLILKEISDFCLKEISEVSQFR